MQAQLDRMEGMLTTLLNALAPESALRYAATSAPGESSVVADARIQNMLRSNRPEVQQIARDIIAAANKYFGGKFTNPEGTVNLGGAAEAYGQRVSQGAFSGSFDDYVVGLIANKGAEAGIAIG